MEIPRSPYIRDLTATARNHIFHDDDDQAQGVIFAFRIRYRYYDQSGSKRMGNYRHDEVEIIARSTVVATTRETKMTIENEL